MVAARAYRHRHQFEPLDQTGPMSRLRQSARLRRGGPPRESGTGTMTGHRQKR